MANHFLVDGEPPLPVIRGCFDVAGSEILFVAFLLLIVYEISKPQTIFIANFNLRFIAVFVLTMWVGVKRYRHTHNQFIVVLYRDGIVYFGLIFGTS